ncbi:SusC/RagA family TonB-linked outer membrane protein [Sphingobacterium tabacisoli]|uniref:SusC/RagA family TonB-linked outer membrane protein n=1 Tax=Sphingobacterium tabacisoli TaxID=2044855 RepID=A0ABW5L2Z5_9SPHI|nr:SusC/RagA family TonB-linked outer membrane protein [Sphingobacterium tabacisoli]
MKGISLLLGVLVLGTVVQAQVLLVGVVKDSLGNPMEKATVTEKLGGRSVKTDARGRFQVQTIHNQGQLLIQHVGYTQVSKVFDSNVREFSIVLKASSVDIEEVIVSTGYQNIPRERATGSFSLVTGDLFNQQEGTDILSRLPAIANSVVMDAGRSQYSPQMMIRGLSTIKGPKDPLIVVDNFPYDGDLINLNPNLVESITILKDAAAASIWGARAANGVIVITTKNGKFNTPVSVGVRSNVTIGKKPDLSYIPQMSSSDFIDVEKELYSRGFYKSSINSNGKPWLSPVVDLLDLSDKGKMSEEDVVNIIDSWREVDSRDDFSRFMYKPAVRQQYFLDASGGTAKFSWLSFMGYDHNKESLGETYQRLNLRLQNIYRFSERLSLAANLYYTQSISASGRLGYNDVPNLLPYMHLADVDGDPLAVPRNYRQSFVEKLEEGKLLDWSYYPLTDWKYQVRNNKLSDVLVNTEIQYGLLKGFNAAVNYQYERQQTLVTSLSDEKGYVARDYINRFAQTVGDEIKFIIPKGSILDKSSGWMDAHNIRGKLSFDNKFGDHYMNALAGVEGRLAHSQGQGNRFYGYNTHNLTVANIDYTRPYPNFITGGGAYIPSNQSLSDIDTRFVSQFVNAAYTYGDRYTVSGSARRDASNLFGLKTNDQWNPFWSTGASWKLSSERFYQWEAVPYVSIRSTYGFSGNVDPAMVAVNTIRFVDPSVFTGDPIAVFDNWYNPNLKWETTRMFNIAIDFRLQKNRLSGSVEYFHKKGENLFGVAPIDYTTGVPPYFLRNVADMSGRGLDIELKSVNLEGMLRWNTLLNFSLYRDKIEEYNIERTVAREYVNTAIPPISGIAGHPVYTIYAYRWAGLDPNTGEAQGYLNGEISKNYSSITGTGTKVEDLVYFGSAVPTHYGNMVNTFSYKRFQLQFGLAYKLGYWFRRPSINYTDLFNSRSGHVDYAKRWQNPGDEKMTDVPVNLFTTNNNRDRFYSGSSVLVEKGDHVRLQYINLGYDLNVGKGFHQLRLNLNIDNVGILWKANKAGIDPDFNIGVGRVKKPTNYTIGVRASF